MRKELLTPRQITCLVALFLIGSTAIIGGDTGVAQDSWIALLLAAAVSMPYFLMLGRLNRLFPDKDFFQLVEMLLGKIAGKIVIALMTWYCFHLSALVLRDFSEFVAVCVMPETPHLPIMMLVIVTVIYLTRSGVETMGKWSIIMLPILMGVVAMTVVLSINNMEPSRLLPIMSHDIGTIAKTSYVFVTFPYLEIITFLCAFQGAIEPRKPCKSYLLAFLLATLTLVVIDVRNTMLLGPHTLEALFFPSYIAIKVIRLGDIVSRIEGSLSINYVIGGVAKIAVCILAATKGITHLFGLRGHKPLVLPMGLLTAALCTTLFETVTHLYEFLETYKLYAIPFQIIIPVSIWILAEIKARKIKAQKTAGSQA
ncbi:MAG: GerAB/ArcD/ProY family transporter [Christensenellales bacterium]|jgi:spore germination protein KB